MSELTDVKGIGETRAQKLVDAGIETVGQLSMTDVEKVADALNIPTGSAQLIVDRAGQVFDEDVAEETGESEDEEETEDTAGDLPPLPPLDDLPPIPEPRRAAPVDIPMAVRLQLMEKGQPLYLSRICRSCKVIKARPNPDISKKRRPGEAFQTGLLKTHIPCTPECSSRKPDAHSPGTFGFKSVDAPRGLRQAVAEQQNNVIVFAEFFRP